MNAKKPTKKAPAKKAGAQSQPDDWRESLYQFLERPVPESLAPDERYAPIEKAAAIVSVVYDRVRFDLKHPEVIRSASDAGHNELVADYMAFQQLAMTLAEGLRACIDVVAQGLEELEADPVDAAAVRSALARTAALARVAKDPKTAAMTEIEVEWRRFQEPGARYPGDAAFARTMHAKYASVLKSDGSIKNAIGKWRRRSSS